MVYIAVTLTLRRCGMHKKQTNLSKAQGYHCLTARSLLSNRRVRHRRPQRKITLRLPPDGFILHILHPGRRGRPDQRRHQPIQIPATQLGALKIRVRPYALRFGEAPGPRNKGHKARFCGLFVAGSTAVFGHCAFEFFDAFGAHPRTYGAAAGAEAAEDYFEVGAGAAEEGDPLDEEKGVRDPRRRRGWR